MAYRRPDGDVILIPRLEALARRPLLDLTSLYQLPTASNDPVVAAGATGALSLLYRDSGGHSLGRRGDHTNECASSQPRERRQRESASSLDTATSVTTLGRPSALTLGATALGRHPGQQRPRPSRPRAVDGGEPVGDDGGQRCGRTVDEYRSHAPDAG
jgi:hypothetical protein